jgi:hypothetical protein
VQNLSGDSWEEMFWKFKELVAQLYKKWKDCLMESLESDDRTYFESIRTKTATKAELTWSLFKLSSFLARKFSRNVILLIDEYEAPINCAFECGYFHKVRSLSSSVWLLLRTSNADQRLFRAWRTFSSLEGDHYEIPLQII